MQQGFRRCFREGLRADGEMRGGIRITARIGADGAVTRLETVTSTAGGHALSAEVVACAEAVVRAARFMPPQGGGATIVIPVTFTTSNGGR
jgi:TonB family protein